MAVVRLSRFLVNYSVQRGEDGGDSGCGRRDGIDL